GAVTQLVRGLDITKGARIRTEDFQNAISIASLVCRDGASQLVALDAKVGQGRDEFTQLERVSMIAAEPQSVIVAPENEHVMASRTLLESPLEKTGQRAAVTRSEEHTSELQ